MRGRLDWLAALLAPLLLLLLAWLSPCTLPAARLLLALLLLPFPTDASIEDIGGRAVPDGPTPGSLLLRRFVDERAPEDMFAAGGEGKVTEPAPVVRGRDGVPADGFCGNDNTKWNGPGSACRLVWKIPSSSSLLPSSESRTIWLDTRAGGRREGELLRMEGEEKAFWPKNSRSSSSIASPALLSSSTVWSSTFSTS